MLKSIGFRALNLCCYTTSSIAKNLPSSRVLFRPFSNTTPCPKFKMDFLTTTASTLPMRPTSRIHKEYDISAEISFIENELHSADDIREVVTKQIRSLFSNISKILLGLRFGSATGVDDLLAETEAMLQQMLAEASEGSERRNNRVSMVIEQTAEARLLLGFFETGALLPPSAVPYCNDDEYLSGCLNMAQDLGRYCVNRACENDFDSVMLARRLLEQLNGKMLEFDFRNGPLRRKYDGLKYALKLVEDIVFEASLVNTTEEQAVQQDAKRQRLMETEMLPIADFDAIKSRLDKIDALREDVIKKSRDVQKLSKQAIFSMHRGQESDAGAKLNTCKELAVAIFDLAVTSHPHLRSGAFSNCIEEWGEGVLFLEWVKNRRIMGIHEMGIINSTEYVGALSDFTGEIGRLGVAAASKRDVSTVYAILQTMISVATGLMQLDSGGRFNKKTEAVFVNLKKMEDIYYELNLLQKGGKSGNISSRDEPPADGN